MPREYYYSWQWDLGSTPEALWPLVSDTNRFNRDTGLPPMKLLGIRSGVRRVRFQFPLPFIQWDEEPFDWTYPSSFGIVRRYRGGPMAEMRVEVTLEARPEGGTRVNYRTWAQPRNALGVLGAWIVIGLYSRYRFESVFRLYDRIAARGASILTLSGRARLNRPARERMRVVSERLHAQGVEPTLTERLTNFLDHADDLSIQRIRPYALADLWGVPRRAALELFLRATREGVMDMYWDLLCPSCRGVAEDHRRLGDVHAHSHCNTCQIDFTANFDHNVEVVFRPNDSVRTFPADLQFCVGSPQRQPHILLTQALQPREDLPFKIPFEAGRYTLRASGLHGSRGLLAEREGTESLELIAKEEGWPAGEERMALLPRLKVINMTSAPQVFKLERTSWSDQAATAADVTTLQIFRDLFSSEVLRPGEEISVGSVTLMFTDLRGSTRLYRQIGDAPAFGRVRDHFKILEEGIAAQGGAIIKTMGDSVMASFRRPAAALRAVSTVQDRLVMRGDGLSLKIGIHHGPCIVVNLNDRLDYFGSTVNIAARLPGFSNGGEVIFSEPIHSDAEAIRFLEKTARPNALTRFEAEIKGYEEPFQLWRMKI